MKSPVCHILLFIVAIVIAQACDNEDYYRYGDFRYDMVTFMGNEDGGYPDLLLYASDLFSGAYAQLGIQI